MIHIIVTGHISMTKKCVCDLEAYLFLTEIKERHDQIIKPLIAHLSRPNPYYYHIGRVKSKSPAAQQGTYVENHNGPSWDYQQKLREITKNHALKVEILDLDKFYDNDLI